MSRRRPRSSWQRKKCHRLALESCPWRCLPTHVASSFYRVPSSCLVDAGGRKKKRKKTQAQRPRRCACMLDYRQGAEVEAKEAAEHDGKDEAETAEAEEVAMLLDR
eukprot:2193792-Amphidinium_carterae.1